MSALRVLAENGALLLPGLADFRAPLGVALVTLQLIGWGRALGARRAGLEIQLAVGWGAVILLLHVWGIACQASMAFPALGIASVGLAALIHPRTRLERAEWLSLGRLFALLVPLLGVLLTLRPVLPDTMYNLLPNAEYLYDFGTFPRGDAARTISIFPGLPYNTQLIGYLAGWYWPSYPTAAMPIFSIVVQAMVALLIARLLNGGETVLPSWRSTAWGLILATAANPGFRPDLNLSDYGEPTTQAMLALSGWMAADLLGRLSERKSWVGPALLLGLALAVLVNIRQSNVALVAALSGGIALVGLVDRRIVTHQAARALALALIAPAGLFLLWRWYVLGHFEVGELKLLPFAEWQFGQIPDILRGMLDQMRKRATLFVIYALVLVAGVITLRKREFGRGARLLAFSCAAILLYNGFLVFTYISHFPVQDGDEAHSYFRYNTHLSLLVGLALLVGIRQRWGERALGGRAVLTGIAIAALALAPLGFLRQVRYDLQAPRTLLWTLAKQAAERIGDDEKLGLVLPGDNGANKLTFRGMLALTEPRRSGIDLGARYSWDEATLAGLRDAGYTRVLVSCLKPGVIEGPVGHPVFLTAEGEGWQVEDLGPYPTRRKDDYWQPGLSRAPFCQS
jgi:hypothetical protein